MNKPNILLFCTLSILSLSMLDRISMIKTHNLEQHNLVELTNINPKIKLDIRYATTNNFTKTIIYPYDKCFLKKAVAEKLNNIQKELEIHNLGLKVFDGYRPRSIQYFFWELVPDDRYVNNPRIGSRHNRGAAVDLTIIDKNGQELDMGTNFDEFSEKSHRNYKNFPENIIKNRKLLEDIMEKHGFVGMPTEWWHFDDINWKQYPVLNIPFEALVKSVKY